MKSLIFSLLFIATGMAGTIKMPADQATIQGGINLALDGDTVLVDVGRYYENIDFKGKKIVVTSRFCEKGFRKYLITTIIDGSRPKNRDTASCVLMIDHEDSSTVLQGFTLTGGGGTVWKDEHGAGVFREGGGIFIAGSSPTIRNNLIMLNEVIDTTGVRSTGGGGIRAGDGNPTILCNEFVGNRAGYGEALVLNFCGVTLRNNLITRNVGGRDFGGAAVWLNGNGAAGIFVINNTIAANQSHGIFIWEGTSSVRNCIVRGNDSMQIVSKKDGPVVTYCDVQGGWNGVGNIDVDPEFVDSSCHLGETSPCIDAGDPATSYDDREDPAAPGSALPPSRGADRNDIGAYGGPDPLADVRKCRPLK